MPAVARVLVVAVVRGEAGPALVSPGVRGVGVAALVLGGQVEAHLLVLVVAEAVLPRHLVPRHHGPRHLHTLLCLHTGTNTALQLLHHIMLGMVYLVDAGDVFEKLHEHSGSVVILPPLR